MSASSIPSSPEQSPPFWRRLMLYLFIPALLSSAVIGWYPFLIAYGSGAPYHQAFMRYLLTTRGPLWLTLLVPLIVGVTGFAVTRVLLTRPWVTRNYRNPRWHVVMVRAETYQWTPPDPSPRLSRLFGPLRGWIAVVLAPPLEEAICRVIPMALLFRLAALHRQFPTSSYLVHLLWADVAYLLVLQLAWAFVHLYQVPPDISAFPRITELCTSALGYMAACAAGLWLTGNPLAALTSSLVPHVIHNMWVLRPQYRRWLRGEERWPWRPRPH